MICERLIPNRTQRRHYPVVIGTIGHVGVSAIGHVGAESEKAQYIKEKNQNMNDFIKQRYKKRGKLK